jgi:peptide/nickel transport system permease protein
VSGVSTIAEERVEEVGRASAPPASSSRQSVWRALLARPSSAVGLVGIALLVFVAIFGPLLSPYNPDATSSLSLAAPSLSHLMGTDQLGRDVFSRMLVGTRISLIVGVGSTAIAMVVGGLLGMLAGMYRNGLSDTLIMRAMDVLFSFPVLVFVPVLSGLAVGRTLHLGPIPISQVTVLTVAIAVVLVPTFARVVRGSVLGEMGKDYILAARSFGARRRDLVLRNLLPNVQAPLVVQAAFSIPIAIITEAAVSFLGFGIQPPQASWGDILSAGRSSLLLGDWWQTVFPALAIAFTVLCFNLVGDALRDALDPQGVAVTGEAAAIGAQGEPA